MGGVVQGEDLGGNQDDRETGQSNQRGGLYDLQDLGG